jgi:hypothetical protein
MTVPKPKTAEEFLEALTAMMVAYNQQPAEDDLQDPQHDAGVLHVQNAQAVSTALPEGQRAPWEAIDGVMPKALNLLMPPALYAKMLWITNNVPKMSLQKIAKIGAEMAADKLIAEHYKPE